MHVGIYYYNYCYLANALEPSWLASNVRHIVVKSGDGDNGVRTPKGMMRTGWITLRVALGRPTTRKVRRNILYDNNNNTLYYTTNAHHSISARRTDFVSCARFEWLQPQQNANESVIDGKLIETCTVQKLTILIKIQCLSCNSEPYGWTICVILFLQYYVTWWIAKLFITLPQ